MNAKLAAIQVNRRLFSSDGFVGNLFVALVGLCGPFMDSGYSKVCPSLTIGSGDSSLT